MTQLEKELELLEDAVIHMQAGFKHLPDFETKAVNWPEVAKVLREVAGRMWNHYPYFHPMYAGQMVKTPHPVARLAYALSMWINPNNHSLEGGRVSSAMEMEAVAELARMFGWSTHLGHLCSGGTTANLEALWVASQLHPGKAIAASDKAHYTHERLCNVLSIPFVSIASDQSMRMSVNALKEALASHTIGTVVTTMGTTMAGAVDPLSDILELKKQHNFRIHADAAYGGYFVLAADALEKKTADALRQLKEVDSVVVDPHKHGMQPFGCGSVLFKDPAVHALYQHNSPYTYLNSKDLHLGEISLECSRSGSAATALWATQRLFPLVPGGQFADNLADSHQAALGLWEKLHNDKRFLIWIKPELDLVLWAVRANKASDCSRLAKELFEQAANNNLHFGLARVPSATVAQATSSMDIEFAVDAAEVTCLRSCLMKSEHIDYLDSIWQVLDRVTARCIRSDKNIICLPGTVDGITA